MQTCACVCKWQCPLLPHCQEIVKEPPTSQWFHGAFTMGSPTSVHIIHTSPTMHRMSARQSPGVHRRGHHTGRQVLIKTNNALLRINLECPMCGSEHLMGTCWYINVRQLLEILNKACKTSTILLAKHAACS